MSDSTSDPTVLESRASISTVAAAVLAVPLLLTAISTSAVAQDRPARGRAVTAEAPQPPALVAAVATETAAIEQELADLIQARSQTAVAELPYLDLQIDLRILSRWLTAQTVVQEPYSDAQAAGWLRSRDLAELIKAVDAWRGGWRGQAPTPEQTEALGVIHGSTFNLKTGRDAPAADALLIALRKPLCVVLGVDAASVIDMRPTLQPQTAATQENVPEEKVETLDDLSGRVTKLTVSAGLRQQLLSAITAARSVPEGEADQWLAVISQAVDIATAAQTGVAIDRAARATLEQQLGQGVALFTDPRLRDIGQQRLDRLQQYRTLTARIGSMDFPPAMQQRLAPIFELANKDADSGAALLTALERLSAMEKQMPDRLPVTQDPVGRQVVAIARLYSGEKSQMLNDISRSTGGGVFAAGPTDFLKHIDTMGTYYDQVQALKRLPENQKLILALKLRSSGALERKVSTAVSRLADSNEERQAEAVQFFENFTQLADAWREVHAELEKPLDSKFAEQWTGLGPKQITDDVTTAASNLANLAAGQGEVEADRIAALKNLGTLLGQLHRLEQTLTTIDRSRESLRRWADLSLSEQQQEQLVDVYRTEYKALFTAALGGQKARTEQKAADRYRGLVRTLDRIATRAAGCAALPTGTAGLIARVTTPTTRQPFADVRLLSLIARLNDLSTAFSNDPTNPPSPTAAPDTKALEQMLDRLNKVSK